MGDISEILDRELVRYTGRGLNAHSFLTKSDDGRTFVVTTYAKVRDRRIVQTSLAVEYDGDSIIIRQDINEKPLVDALVQAGIPREKIVLAYVGEPVPDELPELR
jgi:hypothetical protein